MLFIVKVCCSKILRSNEMKKNGKVGASNKQKNPIDNASKGISEGTKEDITLEEVTKEAIKLRHLIYSKIENHLLLNIAYKIMALIL